VIGIVLIALPDAPQPRICCRKPAEVLLGSTWQAVTRSASRHLLQAVRVACLPYEAFFSLDAIVRTSWRLLITRRDCSNGILRVTRIASRTSGRAASLPSPGGQCGSAPLIAMVVAIQLAASTPMVLAVAGPVLLLWFFSPVIAWWISLPLAAARRP
jgi:cyclic beta-1,2-glucan synthetase